MQDEVLTVEDILEAFAETDGVLPRAAIRQAVERWEVVGAALMERLEAAVWAVAWSDRTVNILMFAIYLSAQMREVRAYRPLCALAAQGERLSEVISDGVTEDLSVILARVYDGDPAPLRALVENAKVDEFTRDAALGALTWLTVIGRIAFGMSGMGQSTRLIWRADPANGLKRRLVLLHGLFNNYRYRLRCRTTPKSLFERAALSECWRTCFRCCPRPPHQCA